MRVLAARLGTRDASLGAMNPLTSPRIPAPFALTMLVLTLDGCRVVGGIFKAGVWVGVLAVFVVIALIAWGVKSMLSR